MNIPLRRLVKIVTKMIRYVEEETGVRKMTTIVREKQLGS